MENLTNLAETLKIVGPRGVHGAHFFQIKGPLALDGVSVPPSAKGVVSRNVEGMSRPEALLNVHPENPRLV